MPYVTYTLDSAIARFFSEVGVSSRSECDEIAHQRYGGEIRPVDIQGVTSYTVVAGPNGSKIVQFRDQTAFLDMRMYALAKEIHLDLVADCSEIGSVGDVGGSKLAIYEMDRLPGENYVTARPRLEYEQQRSNIYSLVDYFVQSWRSEALSTQLADKSAISTECYARFNYLATNLPERFLAAITEVQTSLPALLDKLYPVIVTHSDLNEMNILVNPDSGKITGIVDWSGASMQPFGFALYALDNALGCMGPNGWKWLTNADDLRRAFWTAFQEQTRASESQMNLIRVARKAGILIRYGTAYDSSFPGMMGVYDPEEQDVRYLDALLF